MAWEMLRRHRRQVPRGAEGYQVVVYRPLRRALLLVLLALVVLAAAALGFWLGRGTGELDRTYLAALEVRERAVEARLAELTRELADVRLAQQVDAEAARSLRQTIAELRDRVAGLREEVTFYKSLMDPSSRARGLQIAELEIHPIDGQRRFSVRLVLTQAAERRDWIRGSVQVRVEGRRAVPDGGTSEAVLPLTELADLETYPLPFRFRYFQNLTAEVTLPDGFEARAVTVSAAPEGSGEGIERRFDWAVQPG